MKTREVFNLVALILAILALVPLGLPFPLVVVAVIFLCLKEYV